MKETARKQSEKEGRGNYNEIFHRSTYEFKKKTDFMTFVRSTFQTLLFVVKYATFSFFWHSRKEPATFNLSSRPRTAVWVINSHSQKTFFPTTLISIIAFETVKEKVF